MGPPLTHGPLPARVPAHACSSGARQRVNGSAFRFFLLHGTNNSSNSEACGVNSESGRCCCCGSLFCVHVGTHEFLLSSRKKKGGMSFTAGTRDKNSVAFEFSDAPCSKNAPYISKVLNLTRLAWNTCECDTRTQDLPGLNNRNSKQVHLVLRTTPRHNLSLDLE